MACLYFNTFIGTNQELMFVVADLQIEDQIFPLFDRTHNAFARQTLKNMMLQPLASVDEIRGRQEILRAFMKYHDLLSAYRYSEPDFAEVHHYFTATDFRNIAKPSFFTPALQKQGYYCNSGRLTQAVMLFEKLQKNFFSKLQPADFPVDYQDRLNVLLDFINNLLSVVKSDTIRRHGLNGKNLERLLNHIGQKHAEGVMDNFFNAFFEFEALLSAAVSMNNYKFNFPEFATDDFSIRQFFHPLIKDPVRNDFDGAYRVNLLTGSNMSGKSTLLKSIALCVYFAHIGLAVPATFCRIPFFSNIHVLIGHNDDLRSGYSHFMNEVMRIKDIILSTTEHQRSFAGLDELFSSTSAEEAIELGSIVLQGLDKFKGSFFLISTHLHALRTLPGISENKIGVYNLGCTVSNDHVSFNYQLRSGWSDLTVARLLFDREGLSRLLS